MAYWLAKVKVQEETDRGSVKWLTEQFIVNAENATDAEVKLTKEAAGIYTVVLSNGIVETNRKLVLKK